MFLIFLVLVLQSVDPLTDPSAEKYSGRGNAEKVSAAREKARRTLRSRSSRDSFRTAPETATGGSSAAADDLRDTSPRLAAGNRASRRWSHHHGAASPFSSRSKV